MIQQEIQNPYITWMNNMAVNLPKPDQGNKVPVTAASGTNLKTYDPNAEKANVPPAPADGQIFNDYSAMNADMKQPATTPTATATPAQQPQAYDPQKYIDAIFKQEVPKPEYDKQRQTRTRDLSKVLALGDALSTLGDVFALSKGANVTSRGPNNDVRQLRTEWQGYEDNYKQRMDQHNRQVFQNRLDNLRFGAQMGMAERSYQDQKENQKYNREYQGKRDEIMDQRYQDNKDWIEKTWGSEQEWKRKMFAADEYWKKMGYNLNAAQLDIQKQKAAYDLMQDQLQYQKYIQELDKDNFYILDEKGNKVAKINSKNGELESDYAILSQNPAIKSEMDNMAGMMEGKITPQIMKYGLAKYGLQDQNLRKKWGVDATGYTEEQVNAVRNMATGRSVAPYGSQRFSTPAPAPTKTTTTQTTNWDSYELK